MQLVIGRACGASQIDVQDRTRSIGQIARDGQKSHAKSARSWIDGPKIGQSIGDVLATDIGGAECEDSRAADDAVCRIGEVGVVSREGRARADVDDAVVGKGCSLVERTCRLKR